MPCSVCKCPQHTIRQCDDPNVISLWRTVRRKSTEMDFTEFYNYAQANYNVKPLKIIVAKCNLPSSSRTRIQLIAALVIHLYFGEPPIVESEPHKYVFYRFMIYLEAGMAYEIAFANFRSTGAELLRTLTRNRNISRLRTASHMIQPNTVLFNNIIFAMNDPVALESILGESITANDVYTNIPSIANFLSTLQDVIHPQKLEIKCSVDESFEPKDECEICYDHIKTTYLPCKHEFCGSCVKSCLEIVKKDSRKQTSCPFCRASFNEVISNDSEFIAELISDVCM